MKTHKGAVRLGAGHSLIIAHGPRLSTLEWNEEKAKETIKSFGLFNLATPDSHTFYQNVTAEDLEVKPEDYIKPLFRGLSEVIVRKNFDPIDFAHNKGVLKGSMDLMLGQTVFANHEAFVGNEKGVVSKTFWQEAYKVGDFTIPSGMNLEFMIDSKLHPKLVRELQSKPPTVHSNSVTVQFQWQQSHPKMDFNTFRGKVGTFDDKGELVRRIVSGIDAYHETSFVAHGADPYAQIINEEGKIVNPKYAVARDSFSEEKKQSPFFFFDFKESFSEITIPNSPITNDNQNNNNMKLSKSLILLLATMAGISLSAEQTAHTQLEDAEFEAAFDYEAFSAQLVSASAELESISKLQETNTTLTTELDTLKNEKIQLTADLEEANKFKADNAAALADLGTVETFKATELAEVNRLAALIDPEQAAKLQSVYNSSNLSTLQVFKSQLAAQVEAKFPATCQDCKSENISRQSTSIGNEGHKKPLNALEKLEELKNSLKSQRKGFIG